MANPQQDAFNAIRANAFLAVSATAGLLGLEEAAQSFAAGKIIIPRLPDGTGQELMSFLSNAESAIGTPIFEALFAGATGIQGLGAPGSQEEDAVRLMKRVLGFAAGLPFAIGAVEGPLKLIFGDHLGKELFEGLRELPAEMGMSFFMGGLLDRVVESGISQPLEEAIRERYRPARFEFREIRALMRVHALSEEQGRVYLARAGYPEPLIDLMGNLDRALLSVGDIQQAYLHGLMTEAQAHEKAGEIGYRGDDLDTLIALYLKRAETQGGDMLRSVARSGFVNGELTEAQYRVYLGQANVAAASIELDVEAGKLQRSFHHVHFSVSEIKRLVLDGVINDAVARLRLVALNYSEDDAQLLIADWHIEKARGRGGLTATHIIAYYKGGVIDGAKAYALLVGEGIRTDDARFLVDHPETHPGGYSHSLSPASIVSAFKAGVLTQDEAEARLHDINVQPEEARLLIASAAAQILRGHKPKQPHKTLSEGHVIAAYAHDLVTEGWVIAQLETIGYNPDDATLITATEYVKKSHKLPPDWVPLA